MTLRNCTDKALKTTTLLLLVVALILTFTVSDYYIFNRIGQFHILFVISQWIKKAGIILLPLAVFCNIKSCADLAKYILPAFVLLSCFTFGDYFNASAITPDSTAADLIYAGINGFIPKSINIALFYLSNALYLTNCILLFLRDGYRVNMKNLIRLPVVLIASMPLNIFENFFDITDFSREDFLRFNNFTVWHFLALFFLAGFTVGCYYNLKNKSRKFQNNCLTAMAITLLLQYHSKNSMVMGDGYNVYHTVLACVPLFICNMGVYVCSAAIIFKKRVLYSISFFIHAAGALSVFIYFGKEDLSNYGIFCSYSILYFCVTHCLLFALCILPSALGHYKFRPKDCVIPLIYYFFALMIAAIASAVVTSASMDWNYNGYFLSEDEWLYPNYAFTQINPLPFDVPLWKLTIWRYDLNLLYLLGLYAFYVGIFLLFQVLYYAFLRLRKVIAKNKTLAEIATPAEFGSETAVTDESKGAE